MTGSELSDASFFQMTSASHAEQLKRQQLTVILKRLAGKKPSPQLALLVASAQLDAFDKVKAEIDRLVGELRKEQADEVKERDSCKENLASNGRDTQKAYDKKSNLEKKVEDLTKNVKSLTEEIDNLVAANKKMATQMKRASETRERENADYQVTINDQRMTQAILNKALARMKESYAFAQLFGPGAPHTQTSATHTDPGNGPAKFKKYEENAGGARVVAMLEEVITDSKNLENDALNTEFDAQSAYENFMKDSNKSTEQNLKSIRNMSENRAKAKSELAMADADFKSTMKELENLDGMNKALHEQCDFVLKNFEVRQEARAAEVDALVEAKNILSGMK